MFIHFNGLGCVAAFAAAPALLTAAFVMPHSPQFGEVLMGALWIGGGLACRHYGVQWNAGLRFFERHSLYWIPLEIWGLLYIAFGSLVFAPTAFRVMHNLIF